MIRALLCLLLAGPLYAADLSVAIALPPTVSAGDQVASGIAVRDVAGPGLACDLTITWTDPAGGLRVVTGGTDAAGNCPLSVALDKVGLWRVTVLATAGQRTGQVVAQVTVLPTVLDRLAALETQLAALAVHGPRLTLAIRHPAVIDGQVNDYTATVTRGGQPVPGVVVTFTAGTLVLSGSADVVTGPDGTATLSGPYSAKVWGYGTVTISATATVDGQPLQALATFQATATPVPIDVPVGPVPGVQGRGGSDGRAVASPVVPAGHGGQSGGGPVARPRAAQGVR